MTLIFFSSRAMAEAFHREAAREGQSFARNNRPLSSEYRRGYALCRYPKNEIKLIVKT